MVFKFRLAFAYQKKSHHTNRIGTNNVYVTHDILITFQFVLFKQIDAKKSVRKKDILQ